jgi:DNA-binding NtrC family response regulator
MESTGAIIDTRHGMTPVSCIVAPEFRRDPRDWEPEARRKISAITEIFPRHVLVVDDEPLIRWSVAESLADRGVDVEQASDAASALRTVSNTRLPFDAIVLDLRLPDMNDLSLLGTLRQLMPAASIILMTAFGTPELVADAKAMGASVLNKPFELEELTRLVLDPEAHAA